MSLISDALRKARQETTGREAERRGLKVPPGWDRPTSGSRLGAGLVLGAAIALAAALAGATVVWWAVGRDDSGEPAATVSDAEPAAGAVREDMAGESRTQPGDDPATLRSPAETETPTHPAMIADLRTVNPPGRGTRDVQETGRNQPEPGDDDVESGNVGERPSGPSGSPRSGEAADSEPGTRVFVVDADLGHVTLTLDFIAYRPNDPFAEINGLEVHVGSRIEGLTVEAIARDHVRLVDERGEVILRVR
jgi:hypothetical protein